MALPLYGRHLRPLGEPSRRPWLARVAVPSDDPAAEPATDDVSIVAGKAAAAHGDEVLLLRRVPPALGAADSWPAALTGFRGVLIAEELAGPLAARRDLPADTFALAAELAHLRAGDVVRITPERGEIFLLYRRHASTNSLLVTERCDNFCVMCSQPPKPRDDSWLVDELLAAIPLMSPHTPELGITGGEPTLLGDRLLELIAALAHHLPTTALHLLSNGRGFASGALARRVAALRHPDLMIGIPLYSALAEEHDYVVQARGAYDQTLRGILALKRHGVRVELRVVVHRETYAGLPELARFIVRNLLFVDHVALMGLELMGFARANLEALWIDPIEYQCELAEATRVLARAGLAVSIFNHQLCTLPPELHPYARSSISDWKREYLAECAACSQRDVCGGFFSSSKLRRSRGIHAIGSGAQPTPAGR